MPWSEFGAAVIGFALGATYTGLFMQSERWRREVNRLKRELDAPWNNREAAEVVEL
jgi:hypothetical protein